MSDLLLIALYLGLPAIVIVAALRVPLVDKVGVVVICYVAGVLLGNSGLLTEAHAPLQESLTEAAVALSLPLLLFSMDLRRWLDVAGKAMLSLFLAVASIVGVASAGQLLLLAEVDEGWQIAGMAVGVYTGGTPNVAAIKTALGVDSTLFVVVHTYDMLLGAVYILFCVTVAQRVFGRFLPPFRATASPGLVGLGEDAVSPESTEAFRGMLAPPILLRLLVALLLSGLVVGASVILGGFVPGSFRTAAVILAITTLSIVASFVRPIRRLPRTFSLGMYVIYVFCFVVGSMARLNTISEIDPAVFAYMTVCVFGTMLLHALLCRLFRVDVDTFLITSVAAVCSPPFVPVVAAALRNRTIVLSGLTTGIIGYAVGNYLGVAIAYALRSVQS